MNVFIINLKRSIDRKQSMSSQLDVLNIPYTFFNAIDGLTISEKDIKKWKQLAYPPWKNFNSKFLSLAEIGCIMSHVFLYKKMITESLEWMCILEDDALLMPEFKLHYHNIVREFINSEYELMLLGHSGQYQTQSRGVACSNSKKYNLSIGLSISEPVEAPFGTYAYLIKSSAAQKILNHVFPLRMPIDILTGNCVVIGINMCVLTPPCVHHEQTRFVSTIRPDDKTAKPQFSNSLRQIKFLLGETFPIIRKFYFPYNFISSFIFNLIFKKIPVKLRQIGWMDTHSYADKRLFEKKFWL